MNKQEKLQQCYHELEQISSFLENLLPFANAHNCDFVTNNLWDTLPQAISQRLLSLSEDNLALLPLALTDVVFDETDGSKNYTEGLPHEESNTYFQCSEHMQDSKFEVVNTEAHHIDSEFEATKSKEKWDKSLKPSWVVSKLNNFIKEVNKYKLQNSCVLHTRQHVYESLDFDRDTAVHVSHGMNDKKSHEIEIMTDFCFNLTKHFNLRKASMFSLFLIFFFFLRF